VRETVPRLPTPVCHGLLVEQFPTGPLPCLQVATVVSNPAPMLGRPKGDLSAHYQAQKNSRQQV
jgi:hypothetical protein